MNAKLPITALFLLLGLLADIAYAADNGKTNPSAAKTERPNCLKETGTHLKLRDKECLAAPGQVITHEDIENSGAATTAEAIRNLSPAAQVHGR